MRTNLRSILLAVVVSLAAGTLAGCDGGDKPAATPAATPTPAPAAGGAAARDACPTEAEIAAVIASPVKRLKGGGGCVFQSEDEKTDVSIMILGAASGEQLLKELRESAAARPNVNVEPVTGIGDSANMYATPGQAAAVAMGGGKSFYVDISSPGGGSPDRKPQVIQILRLLMR
jgi:hypothetical protein